MGRFSYLSRMPLTRASDQALLARTALGLWDLQDLPSFRTGVLRLLQSLIGYEMASYNEIGADSGEVYVVADPADSLNVRADMLEAFGELVLQNPLAAHCAQTGDSRALRMSDFISRRELHALDLYDRIYRHIDTEYQLAFTVPSRRQLIGITLNRSKRDFDERELALLDGARAIMVAAYQNLHDRARLDAIVRATDGESAGPYAVLLVEQSGQIVPAHDRAELLLSRLAANPLALGGLREWARAQRRIGPGGCSPLRLGGGLQELQAHYLHGDSRSLDAIAIRRPVSSAPAKLSTLGLTRRQAEVLELLVRGDTNADIAAALTISEHTVRHHLEDIYRRLGVRSRVAAAHAATRMLAEVSPAVTARTE
jgi:DNA-binding CsgD family transcriptional regulator